jgi:hypothetical protein
MNNGLKNLMRSANQKIKQFGAYEWRVSDFIYDPEYHDSDYVRNYCYLCYKDCSICSACEANRAEFLNIKNGPIIIKEQMERIEKIEAFLKNKFPEFKDL